MRGITGILITWETETFGNCISFNIEMKGRSMVDLVDKWEDDQSCIIGNRYIEIEYLVYSILSAEMISPNLSGHL